MSSSLNQSNFVASVDANPSFGTLTGLVNELVFRGKNDSSTNGSLESKLFKNHHYSVTANYLTDELTGRINTKETLSISGSPSVRPFLSLDQMEVDLLLLLARLTPRRQYQPVTTSG